MKLVTLDDPLVDFRIALSLKEQILEHVLEDAADKQILVDYSALEQEDVNKTLGAVDMDEFIEDKELEL